MHNHSPHILISAHNPPTRYPPPAALIPNLHKPHPASRLHNRRLHKPPLRHLTLTTSAICNLGHARQYT
ncbi:hypothetical protein IQ06DRAFT_293222 [Phaeosphaeriaceae sp. SRC1lsM3a]|nr:hypothetical protein IQ06DRAFT_293222 [Stagonospora sp. SRC1lsM3a]